MIGKIVQGEDLCCPGLMYRATSTKRKQRKNLIVDYLFILFFTN
jgi:hypothetical protein